MHNRNLSKTIGTLKELQRFVGVDSSFRYSVALNDAVNYLIRLKRILDGVDALKGEQDESITE